MLQKRPERVAGVAGLGYIPRYVTAEEQTEVLRIINKQPWDTTLSRRVQHYGYAYHYYQGGQVTPLGPLPSWLLILVRRLHRDRIFPVVLNQAIVNEYRPGQGIAPHTDRNTFGPVVATLSLGATWPMQIVTDAGTTEIRLETGSLLVFAGEARHAAKHGIKKQPKLPTRVSITFRTVER